MARTLPFRHFANCDNFPSRPPPNRRRERRTVGAHQGTIAASLILAALLLLGAAASRYTEHPLPQFHPEAQIKMVDQFLTKKSPAELWLIWTENYQQLGQAGFTAMEDPRTAPIQRDIDQHRRIQLVLAALAGTLIALAIVLWLTGTATKSPKKSSAQRATIAPTSAAPLFPSSLTRPFSPSLRPCAIRFPPYFV